MPEPMIPRVRVVGPVSVLGAVHPLRPATQRLLSILALEPRTEVSDDRLVDRMWPHGAPRTMRNTLQAHVCGLRRALGRDRVVRGPTGYRLEVDPLEVDAWAIAHLVADAGRVLPVDAASAASLADAALGLWRGQPWTLLCDDGFARPAILRLEELRVVAQEVRLAGLCRSGRPQEALADLEALVVEHPQREALWGWLATARHAVGRRAEALQAFRSAASALAEAGLDPGAALQDLHARLLRDGAPEPAGVVA